MAITRLRVASWGLRQITGATTYGVVTSLEVVDDLMSQNETDETGAVCRVVEYDRRKRLMFTVQAAATTNPPEIGMPITVNSVKGWVQHTEVIEQNQAFKKIRVTMECFKNCDTIG